MRNVLTIAAAALGVATASNAFAQDQGQDPDALIPVNVSVRLGIALPLDPDLRDYGSTFLAAGLEYKISRSLLRSGETYFSLDFMKSNNSDKGYVIPFTINQRFYNRTLADGRRTYFLLGAGIGFLKGDDWTRTFIARAGGGAELGERIFLEGVLTLGDKRDGISANNVGLYVGYRF